MNHGSVRGLARFVAFSGILFSSLANASLTPVLPNSGNEPDLAETGGILDHHFGLENLSRVDDDLDQYWQNNGRIDIKTLGKWAGFKQSFGYINGAGDFTSVLNVNNRSSRPAGHIDRDDSGSIFRFALDPSGAPLWHSDTTENSDLLDHMVTWQITSSHNKNLVGAFVIGWEDLAGGGDQDFNDLVLLVKGDVALNSLPGAPASAVVPVPAALWLFGSGLLGLVAMSRRGKR